MLPKRNILCIDNRASSNLAIYLLELAGFEVKTASSISDGIILAQTQQFDLYLLNHALLEERSVGSCNRLDESAPSAPILFYSTVLYPYELIRPIHCQIHDHMLSPVSVCDVQAAALRLIEKYAGQYEPVQHASEKSDSGIALTRIANSLHANNVH